MMKQEFEQLIGKEVSTKEYIEIEHVYTWHPAIKDNGGKRQIAQLYKDFGMSVIRGMVEVADYMMELDKEKQKLRRKLEIINKREEMLSEGFIGLEKMIQEVEDKFIKADSEKQFERAINELRENDTEGIVDIAVEIAKS